MPKQVQIRRDTAVNVAGITPAAGEMFLSTDTNRTSIGDGATAGGIWSGGPLLNDTEYLQGTDVAGTGNVNIARVKADDTVEFPTASTFLQNVTLAAGKTLGITSGFNADTESLLTGPSAVPASITSATSDAFFLNNTGTMYTAKTSVADRNHWQIYNTNTVVGKVRSEAHSLIIEASSTDASSNLQIDVNTAGVSRTFVFESTSFRTSVDNVIDIGSASNRMAVIYAGTGTINTSDEDDKTFSELSEDDEWSKVLAAVSATKIQAYQFNDAIEAKGADNARMHFGIGAQTLKENFEAQGLDAFKYGVLCFDEWEEETKDVFGLDEEGNEVKTGVEVVTEAGSRYGIRYDEFFAIKMAALEA